MIQRLSHANTKDKVLRRAIKHIITKGTLRTDSFDTPHLDHRFLMSIFREGECCLGIVLLECTTNQIRLLHFP